MENDTTINLLRLLHRQGGSANAAEIAAELGLAQEAVEALVEAAVERGLVRRQSGRWGTVVLCDEVRQPVQTEAFLANRVAYLEAEIAEKLEELRVTEAMLAAYEPDRDAALAEVTPLVFNPTVRIYGDHGDYPEVAGGARGGLEA